MDEVIPEPWASFDNHGIQAAQYNVDSYFWGIGKDLRRAYVHGPLRVGEKAPTFKLPTVDGDVIDLDDLRTDKHVALIFGSGGAGPCVREMPHIEDIYQSFRDSPSTVVFIYTREVHPNESIPPTGKILSPHRSMEKKIEQAKAFRDEVGLTMPVCVDDLIGTTDRAYGCLPFAQAVVDPRGILIQRSEWADRDLLEITLRNIERDAERNAEGRPKHERSVAFTEALWYR